jgi:hypothetical protein
MLNTSTLETPLHDPSVTDNGHTACPFRLGSRPLLRHWMWCVEFRKYRNTDTYNATVFRMGMCEQRQKKILHICNMRHLGWCLQITSTFIKTLKHTTDCFLIYSRLNVPTLIVSLYWDFQKGWCSKKYTLQKKGITIFTKNICCKYTQELWVSIMY